MVSSVRDKGVTQPAIVRPREDGGYEIVSGHRRQKASELAGFVDMLQEQLDEDDALDFVCENIEYIVNRCTLDDAYKEAERPRLEKEVLQPYWSRAEKTHSQ